VKVCKDGGSLYLCNVGNSVHIHRLQGYTFKINSNSFASREPKTVTLSVTEIEGVCLSLPGFLLAVIFLLSVIVVSSLLCIYFWLKLQKGRKSLETTKTVHLDTYPISKA
jgi:hypothetical protein